MIDELHATWKELTAEGGPFALRDIEVRGVPMREFVGAPPNLRVIWELAAGHGDTTYIVYEDERYSYADMQAQARALAHHLRDEHAVGSGDRVAVAMRNYPEWIVSHWAVLSLGAALVGMNAWWTTAEMEYGLNDSRPKVLIADDERLGRLEPVLEAVRESHPLPIITVRSDRRPAGSVRWEEVVDATIAPDTLPEATIDPDDDALIFYTSGTTGFPKGAQLTHRGCVSNFMNLAFWATCAETALKRAAAAAGVGETGDGAPEAAEAVPLIQMTPTPLFHVTACNCALHPLTLAGGTLVFMYRWDAGRALELIEREGITRFSGVPTMGRELLTHPDRARRDVSSLRSLAGGGAPTPPDLVEKFNDSLEGRGAPTTGYGLTETCGIITANSAQFYLTKPLSCGPVMPSFDAKLIADDGSEVPTGTDGLGELVVRGPCVIKGYLNRPEATRDAIEDGWFHTGDIARIDADGFVYIVDRLKDMVLRGGENVYCTEVEAAIHDYDGVAEASVFGIPDERLGEDVAAAVVLEPGVELDTAGLQAFLAERLAKHKIPSTIWFRTEPLPRNASGKFLKRALRDELVGARGTAAAATPVEGA